VQLVSDKGNEFRGFNIYIYPEEDTVEERVEVIHIDIAVQLEEFLDKEMPVKTGLAEVLRVSRNSVYDLGLILEPVFSFLAELGLDGTCHDVLYARERDHILTIELNSISKVKVYEFWKSLKDEDNGT